MILRTLLQHYLRHPMQALFLLTGIVIANVLLIGTQLINAQARSSYTQGEQVFGARPVGRIVAANGDRFIDERRFIELRRLGFDRVAPLLSQVVRSSNGQALELFGIDALSMPQAEQSPEGTAASEAGVGDLSFGDFAFPPYRVLGAPARLAQLKAQAGEQLLLANGARLPPLHPVSSGELGHRLLVDLGALQVLSDTTGRLSAILVFERSGKRLADLLSALPLELAYRADTDTPDPTQMTRSFHLNLAAMGLLACVVGLFLTYNAVAFSYTDRRELLRRLRLSGISRQELAVALLTELALFLVTGALLGLWLGGLLAASLLPGVGQTLAQLYGVYISYPSSLLPSGYLLPLLTTALAALLCAVFPLRKTLHAPLLTRWTGGWQQRTVRRRDHVLLMLSGMLLLVAIALAAQARSTWTALGGMACLLLASALCLPAMLRFLLDGLSRLTPDAAPRLSWLLADCRWLLGPASLALMAMTMALVANSGLNTMISSFRDATDSWLEQRLAAQLYLQDEKLSSRTTLSSDIALWLTTAEPQAALTVRYRSEVDVTRPAGGNAFVEVVDLAPTEPFRSSVRLLDRVEDAEARFHAGEGIFVSERAWRLDGWDLETRSTVCRSEEPLPVLGIYYDYGNPRSQWMVTPALFRRCWSEEAPSGIAIHGPEDIDWRELRLQVVEQFALDDNAVIDQRDLRAVGLAVFDRTFSVTRALNLLTLLVAGIGIFCSISAIHHHRVGQQALLASLGLSRAERGCLLLVQWGVLGLLCVVLVLPFGTALGWYLSSVVTPAAFGWSFPLRVELQPFVSLAALACAALVLAVLIPSLRLLRVSPALMLREQSL